MAKKRKASTSTNHKPPAAPVPDQETSVPQMRARQAARLADAEAARVIEEAIMANQEAAKNGA